MLHAIDVRVVVSLAKVAFESVLLLFLFCWPIHPPPIIEIGEPGFSLNFQKGSYHRPYISLFAQ